MSTLELKKSYNFDLHPSAILGGDYKNVLVMSIMDYETALAFQDVAALHAQVYPTLPQDVPDDPSKYNYVKVRTAIGTTILGIPWIDESTIVEVTKSRHIVTIEDTDSSNTTQLLRNILSQNGFNKFTIEVETTSSTSS